MLKTLFYFGGFFSDHLTCRRLLQCTQTMNTVAIKEATTLNFHEKEELSGTSLQFQICVVFHLYAILLLFEKPGEISLKKKNNDNRISHSTIQLLN